MSVSDGSTFSGGARPKTTFGEGRKEHKNVDNKCNEHKSNFKSKHLTSSACKCENIDHFKLQPSNSDIYSNSHKDYLIQLNSSKCKPLWNNSKSNYDFENLSDFSTNSVNLFRTKEPTVKSIVNNSDISEDHLVTGSLFNLSLNTNNIDRGGSMASHILHDEIGSTRNNDTVSTQSCKCTTCHSCYTDEPEAFVKWKTAGLALRQLLSKKVNKNRRPKDLPPLYKQHRQNADHTSCWLQRLHDFDEYDEEYFSCCTCEDNRNTTLTKTESSSSLDSLECQDMLNLSTDVIQNMISEKCKMPSNSMDNICINKKTCTSTDSFSIHNHLELFDNFSQSFQPSIMETTIMQSDCNETSSHNSMPLANTICNSIVWEMLQKPYALCSHGDNVNEEDKCVSAPLSQTICDISMCNNNCLSGTHVSADSTGLENTISNPISCFVPPTDLKTSLDYGNSQSVEEISRSCHQLNHFEKSLYPIFTDRHNVWTCDCDYKADDLLKISQPFETNNSFLQCNMKFDKTFNKSPVHSVLNSCEKIPDSCHCLYNQLQPDTSFPSFHNQYSPDQSSHTKSNGNNGSDEYKCFSNRTLPVLNSLTPSNNSDIKLSTSCELYLDANARISNQQPQTALDASISSGLGNHIEICAQTATKESNLCETESEVTDCSSVYGETSGDIYFSEGTDSSDLPSKFLRLNSTKNNSEYIAQSTNREKKKKVLHVRKCHRKSGSTSSDLEDNDLSVVDKDLNLTSDGTIDQNQYLYRNSFLLSEILHPSTPLARFLKSHIPNDEESASMPWENIEDGLSVEGCADGDSNHSLTGISEGSTHHTNGALFNLSNGETEDAPVSQVSHISQAICRTTKDKARGAESKLSNQYRPSTALRKLLNMEIHTELKGDNSQYSPETWVRLVDQISLPFECAEEDSNNDVTNDTVLVDSIEKSNDGNEFADLCLPSYASSASCDADDEFECDCEHCQLLKSMGDTVDVTQTEATITQNNSSYTWPDFLEDDTSLDLDLSELRPLEPLLTNLQDIPQDLIDLMFQNVIMQMLAVHPELMGDQAPPPVPQDIIDNLPILITNQIHIDQEVSCPICLCSCQLDESLTKLCCQHLFHPLCIQAWLAKSGTCPVCRCTINGETS